MDHPPRRIVWCYGQWQPLYEEMRTEFPRVEFVKGIPYDLESESYFDVKVSNAIILDDLFAEAKNDPRVANLFCRGSHHRNLSVYLVTQNLFSQGRAARDIVLNCHYLVLFNNPVDRQQVSLLARRIYPRQPDYMMKLYESAVSRPHGYLFVDLKGQTPEGSRLRKDVLPGDGDTSEPSQAIPCMPRGESLGQVIRGTSSCETDTSRCLGEATVNQPCSCEAWGASTSSESEFAKHGEKTFLDTEMPQCDVCQAIFPTWFLVGKHVQKEHEGDDESDEEVEELLNVGKQRHLESDEESEDQPARKKRKKAASELWDFCLRPKVEEDFLDEINERRDEYVKEGHSQRVAKNMAANDYLREIRKCYRRHFTDMFVYLMDLKGDPLFEAIAQTTKRLRKVNKLDTKEAVEEAVRLHKTRLGEHAIKERKGKDLENTDSEKSEDERDEDD